MLIPFGRKVVLAALASSTLLVAGCATETTYHPATGQGFYRNGYSDREVEPGRFMVTFSGNSVTSRDTVERYLLFRSAELTLQQGFDYFVLANRDTDLQSRTYSTGLGYGGFGGYGGGFYGGFGGPFGWGPSWRYHGGGFGWRSWDPWGGGPFWGDNIDLQTVDRYEASADIIMRHGQIPSDNLRAFNARKIIDTLGPTVVLPTDRRK